MDLGAKVDKLLAWRKRNISDRFFILILSVIVGALSGLAAVVIKRSVVLIEEFLAKGFNLGQYNAFYLILPVIGVLATVIFTHYILRQEVGHGIPAVLFAISRKKGMMKPHNLFSSIVASTLTVGFGGSVGLEGPTVATGAAIGSNLGKVLRLNYKQVMTLLGCASAGAMAAIFKAPIAAVVFALEVIMLNLNMSSLVPLVTSSVMAVLTSYLFLGQTVLYEFKIEETFILKDVPFFILLGFYTGLLSIYFNRMYVFIAERFERLNNWIVKLLLGGLILGVLIFILPSLFGEGYNGINGALNGKLEYIFRGNIFSSLRDNQLSMILVLVLLVFLKVVATSVTFASGGVGGIFAPTLFVGANAGLLFALIMKYFGFDLATENYVLVAMAGMIAGVIHAPLTAVFLIAELTGGYQLFVPLMITGTISYAFMKIFVKNSVYTYQLAHRGELITHDKDKAALNLMSVKNLIETNFLTVGPDQTLGELVNAISRSSRSVFPVVDENNTFMGVVWVNDIRHIVFKPDLYDNTYVRDLMFMPSPTVSPSESMEDVAYKFETSSHYNLAVIDQGKYVGFVSRANVFSKYRSMIRNFMEE